MAWVVRGIGMSVCLAGVYCWMPPLQNLNTGLNGHFEERAAEAGCRNVHSMVVLGNAFTNIMPWLSSVGAAVAAADYDNDGYPDLYVVNSGRNDRNHLFHNRGDGTFEDVTAAAGVGCTNVEGGC